MDPKTDEGIYLGYQTNNKTYREFNNHKKFMMESINVIVDETKCEVISQETIIFLFLNNMSYLVFLTRIPTSF